MSSLRMEVRMDLRDVVLVIENDKGTEINMLMSLDDYKKMCIRDRDECPTLMIIN